MGSPSCACGIVPERCFAAIVLALLALAWMPMPAQGADRSCGELGAKGGRLAVFVVEGSVSCAQAMYVISYVISHGEANSPGAPGQSPAGWTCGWGYRLAEGKRDGRTGPACERGRSQHGKSQHYQRVDGRTFLLPEPAISERWPFPLERPAASPEAQAFMPLIFLDDDEHWPLSNPDWFLHVADVSHCPTGDSYAGCRPISTASMQDVSLRFLRYEPEQHRTGAPGVVFVNQTEPGQPAALGSPPISSAYRFFDYWWYYSFNRGPYGVTKPVFGSYDHLSDWEGATVAALPGQVDGFDFVAMSAHEAAWSYLPGVLRCGEGLQGDKRHQTACTGRRRVNVYAAEGTHANYPRRCGDSLLELNPANRGLCLQTGMLEITPNVRIPVPEGRFNGKDDAPSRIPATDLKTLVGVGPADWTGYQGFWDATGDVPSPNSQPRFMDPLTGQRECTRRWEDGNDAAPCNEQFRRPAPSAARLKARAAQVAGTTDPCENWFGPMVKLSVCQPQVLRAALVHGRLGEDGSLRLAGARGPSDTAPGVAQAVGASLTPAHAVKVFGDGEPATVRVRIDAPDATVDARFDNVQLAPTAPLTVAVTRRREVRATTALGRILRPTALRRTDQRRPRVIRRAIATRRAGGILVRFSKVSGSVGLDLLTSRSSRPLITETVRGRRGRATLYAPSGTRVRYVAVRRLSRTLVPSLGRVVRVRG
jgi:hypothetical protein